MQSISVTELKKRIDEGTSPIIIDVREDFEIEICKLPDTRHIPWGQLPDHLSALDASTAYILMCKAGGRSAQATQFLSVQGYKDVTNLEGGINEWSRSIDPSVPLY